MKTSIKTIGLLAALAMALTGPLFSQVPDLTKDTQAVDRSLAATPPQLKPPLHGLEAAGEGMKRLLGVLAPVSSGESRPTLKFTGSAPATVVIEEAFKMSLDNLIDINSIPYDPGKWNDTGLLETATDSRFLRAAPAYGENPWVSGPKLRGGAEC